MVDAISNIVNQFQPSKESDAFDIHGFTQITDLNDEVDGDDDKDTMIFFPDGRDS